MKKSMCNSNKLNKVIINKYVNLFTNKHVIELFILSYSRCNI